MNTPLRDEILKIIRQPRLNGYEVVLGDEDIADQILSLLASKMPEKKEEERFKDYTGYSLQEVQQEKIQLIRNVAYNKCLFEVKSILKGGTE